jgi:hypothetical protein
MRGSDARTGELFSYVDLEDRVPAQHLRASGRLCPESPLPPSLRGRGSGPPGYARCPGPCDMAATLPIGRVILQGFLK